MNYVVSLYDFTGEAVRPWAIAGFACICYDIQHSLVLPRRETFPSGGSITYVRADLHSRDVLGHIANEFQGRAAFMMAFPVCTDMAVSGSKHFVRKKSEDFLIQEKAADHARWCGTVGDALDCPYFVENPVSVLATLWRKSDHIFDPFEYGGYIPASKATHPKWPHYIAPRDAYPKKTCLWAGGGFVMPQPRPVEVEPGWSRQQKMLGGKSMKTKNIRSATPRGFALANFEANCRVAVPAAK